MMRTASPHLGGPPHRESTFGHHIRPFRVVTHGLIFALATLTALGCARRSATPTSTPAGPRTGAERSGYQTTSGHADVVAFLDTLRAQHPFIALGQVGTTHEGRAIPYAVLSRPLFATAKAARRSGRPIVYVQANIHAGEVEGKEALQAVLRDLLQRPAPNVLDSIVLVAVPIYNSDGNERLDSQARSRGAQNGPAMVGTRPNAQDLDLNRDYIKLDAPETRASLRMFNTWDPHVFVDLHTTNGSYHGYALTYAQSLNPAAELAGLTFGGAFVRDSLGPELERRTMRRHQLAIFPYGNFSQDDPTQPPRGWLTYDHRPRFGTNYYALRGRISILSEAYSHDPFERRMRSTYVFVQELLSLVGERSRAVLALAEQSDRQLTLRPATLAVPVRARLTTKPFEREVLFEPLVRTTDTLPSEIGVRRGFRRSGRFLGVRMPITDRFDPTTTRRAPWGYAIAASDTSAIARLRFHGVRFGYLARAWTGEVGEQFEVDSTVVAPAPFQKRREVRLVGRWLAAPATTFGAGTVIVPEGQPLGVSAMYLLEPESDDGLVNWDIGGRASNASLRIWRLDRDPQVVLRPDPR